MELYSRVIAMAWLQCLFIMNCKHIIVLDALAKKTNLLILVQLSAAF